MESWATSAVARRTAQTFETVWGTFEIPTGSYLGHDGRTYFTYDDDEEGVKGMTELQKQVDTTVGNEVERFRTVDCLGFIALGKQLRDEELKNAGEPVYTDSTVQDMLKQMRTDTGQKVMAKVRDILNSTGFKQVLVEQAQAKAIDAIAAKYPDSAAALAEVKAEIAARTADHKNVIVNERDPGLAAIEALYK